MATEYYHFIPANDDELGSWANNFKEKISAIGPLVGITAEQVTAAESTADIITSAIEKGTVKKQEYQEAMALKRVTRQREVKQLVTLAIQIKRSVQYTENMGRELGIIGSQTSTDEKQIRPQLKVSVMPGYVNITFRKKRQTGVSIYTRLRGTTGWEKLVSGATASPFKDERPLQTAGTAENREYMARYWENAAEIGQESDIVSILFGG